MGILEEVGFGDIKISVKHQNPASMIAAYRLLATRVDYPLHLGVTEAGTPRTQNRQVLGRYRRLLAQGIGDTIRVSLTAPPIEEVKAGNAILGALGLRPKKLDLVACPSCGRAEVDVFALANAVEERMAEIDAPMRVAVMGCIVNGPGEAPRGRRRRGLGQGQGPDLPPRPGDPHRARGRRSSTPSCTRPSRWPRSTGRPAASRASPRSSG